MAEGEGIDLIKTLDEIGIEKLDKYEKYMVRIADIVEKLNKSGLVDFIAKAYAKKAGVDIKEVMNNPLQVIAPSNTHKFLFDELSKAPEDMIKNMLVQMIKAAPTPKTEPVEGAKKNENTT